MGKVSGHRVDITGNQDSTLLCGNFEDFRIRGSWGEDSSSELKIYGGLSSTEALDDFRMEIRVGLKTEAQTYFSVAARFASSSTCKTFGE